MTNNMTMETPEETTSETSTETENSGSSTTLIMKSTENSKTQTDPTPEPEAPKPKKAQTPQSEKPTKCELKAKGTFIAGIASLKVDKKCDVSCNRTQQIKLEQNGRIFTYVRAEIEVAPDSKKGE